LPNEVINKLVNKLQKLAKKYETNLQSIEKEIKETSEELSFMIDELEANEYDIQGLKALKNLLGIDDDK
jgi:type I restriction enzyme M protein